MVWERRVAGARIKLPQRREGAKLQQLTTRSWRRFKSVLQPATRFVFPVTPRAANDYATHIPVLIGLAAIRRIERVLEFGCGHYSTKTFLNRTAFPHLSELQAVENDPAWAETIRTAVRDDIRCTVHVVSGAVADVVTLFDLESFDLLLIDDSTNAEERAATIRSIARCKPQRPWIVIHDYEIDEYRDAASGFNHRFTFKAYNPHTGLVFNSANPRTGELKLLARRVEENRAELEPDDALGWVHALDR